MNKVLWSNKLEIGIERIDFEHRIFADLIDILAEKIDNDAGAISIARTVRELIKYADFHFTSEENIMEELAYPGRKEHIEQHRRLQDKLCADILAMSDGKIDPREFLEFLVDWFVEHTSCEDAKISAYRRFLGLQ